MKHFLTFMVFSSLTIQAYAADSPWRDIQTRNNIGIETAFGLQSYRRLQLDEHRLLQQLKQAASELPENAQARAAATTFTLPLPDGSFTEVIVKPTEILAPEIAAEYPDMLTWKVTGTDGKIISGVIDMTPAGFHAMLDTTEGDTLFIDPQGEAEERFYLSFSKRANRPAFKQQGWSCSSHSNIKSFRAEILPATSNRTGLAQRIFAAKAGETLYTYRIAIAATAEYTAFHGSREAAYNSIVTTVNRLNQVYERDLSVRLILVSGLNTIYTDAATDPYSNNSPVLLLRQNVTNLDEVLGSSAYDIGHVLTTDGGGLASIATVCGPYKAEGMSGLTRPGGDSFIIDYVAHEIGHQLGATHTFNGIRGACTGSNRESLYAYEPGSGSTIMAYTGLCDNDNLQTDSDSMMHSASISQITDYIRRGNGASCAGKIPLNNSNPLVNAGADYTIPAGTPFILTGSGSDPDGDTLSYSWEQIDSGAASYVNVDLGDNALIRAFSPTSSPVRHIPRLSDLTRNLQTNGEFLPATDREMNFRLQVRDGHGGIGYDDMKITVRDTGENFAVTMPSSTSLIRGAQQIVNWNVAGTNQPPINCSAVDIALTTNGGDSFITLLTRTPNDGNATVNLPNNLGSRNHIRVKCSDGIFFALSATSPDRASRSNSSAVATGSSVTASGGGGGGSLPVELLLGGFPFILYRLRRGHHQ